MQPLRYLRNIKPHSIQSALLYSNVLSLLLLAIPLASLTIFLISARLHDQIDNATRQLRTEKMEVIKERVDEAVNYAEFMQRRLGQRAESRLKSRVQDAYQVASGLYESQKDKVSRSELKVLIREALRGMHFDDDHGYFYALDFDGMSQLAADRPELEGSNLLPLKDRSGQFVARDMITIATTKGEGFYNYRWTKPKSPGNQFRKLSYVKNFEPLNWVIGSGLYLDDLEDEIKSEVLDRIGDTRWGDDGYLFIFNEDGVIQQNANKTVVGSNLLSSNNPQMRDVAKRMLALSKTGGGFQEYVWDKAGNGTLVNKIAYSRGYAGWKWIIGSGVYLQDLETEQAAMVARLRSGVIAAVALSALLIFAALAGAYWHAQRFRRRLVDDMQPILNFLAAAPEHRPSLQPAQQKYAELRTIAHAAVELNDHWRTTQTELRQREESQRLLLDRAPYGLVEVLPDGYIGYINPAFTRILGYDIREMPTLEHWWNQCYPHAAYREQVQAAWQQMRAAGNQDSMVEHVFLAQAKDGAMHEIRYLFVRMNDDRIIVTLDDITDRRAAEKEIENLAFYDALTGLPNRRLLSDRLQQCLATSARNRHYGALLFLDLDRFKQLNDTQGHHIGDRLLVEMAQRLRQCIREGDTLARQGGDEFILVLEDLSADAEEAASQAKLVAEKVIAQVRLRCDFDGVHYQGTVSVGITLFQGLQQSREELLKRADMAMYQAKADGRNAYAFFDPDMQQRISAQVQLENELHLALQQQQLQLWYQPQVDTRGHCFGVEALLRWAHPQRGMVPPGEFIALAEETGQIIAIGHWVMQQACRQLAAWAEDPRTADLGISVNVSAKQFAQPQFVEEVLELLQASGARATHLKLEITESLLAENLALVAQRMNALRATGVSFSLDDFGTGYSSLTYLKSLPLDQLKIDQSFVRNIRKDQDQDAICRAVIALGKALGMGIIAEGVETPEQWQWLVQEHCEAAQGYLFCRPLPATELLLWLEHRNAA